MIDPAVAHHFEILGRVAVGSLCRIVGQRVCKTGSFDRFLVDAVVFLRLLDANELEDGRGDIDDVMELGTQAPSILDFVRPGDGCNRRSASSKPWK
jgi:hypothetical protein